MYARQVQRLTGIDVADANDNLCIHDELLDSDTPTAGLLSQVITVKIIAQGFGSQLLQQPVMRRILRPMQGSEAPRIAKPECLAGGKLDVHMIVDSGRSVVIDDHYTAGHAQVQNRRAVARVDEQVLGAPRDRGDDLPGQVSIDVVCDGPAQATLANNDACDPGTDDVRLYTATAGFHFRQFRHALRSPAI